MPYIMVIKDLCLNRVSGKWTVRPVQLLNLEKRGKYEERQPFWQINYGKTGYT